MSNQIATRPQQGAIDIMALAITEEDRRDAGRAMVLADSGLVPEAMAGKPAAVLTAMWVCDALNIERTPLNFANLYSVHGRPGIMASLQLGLAHRAGHTTRWLTTTDNDKEQSLEMDGQVFTFTLAMAAKAQLTSGTTWKAYTADMLRWRAVTRAVKGTCPEVLLGLRSAAPELFKNDPDVVDIGNAPEAIEGVQLIAENEAKTQLLNACKAVLADEASAKAEARKIWDAAHISGPVHPGYLAKLLEEATALGAPFGGEEAGEDSGTLFGEGEE